MKDVICFLPPAIAFILAVFKIVLSLTRKTTSDLPIMEPMNWDEIRPEHDFDVEDLDRISQETDWRSRRCLNRNARCGVLSQLTAIHRVLKPMNHNIRWLVRCLQFDCENILGDAAKVENARHSLMSFRADLALELIKLDFLIWLLRADKLRLVPLALIVGWSRGDLEELFQQYAEAMNQIAIHVEICRKPPDSDEGKPCAFLRVS